MSDFYNPSEEQLQDLINEGYVEEEGEAVDYPANYERTYEDDCYGSHRFEYDEFDDNDWDYGQFDQYDDTELTEW